MSSIKPFHFHEKFAITALDGSNELLLFLITSKIYIWKLLSHVCSWQVLAR